MVRFARAMHAIIICCSSSCCVVRKGLSRRTWFRPTITLLATSTKARGLIRAVRELYNKHFAFALSSLSSSVDLRIAIVQRRAFVHVEASKRFEVKCRPYMHYIYHNEKYWSINLVVQFRLDLLYINWMYIVVLCVIIRFSYFVIIWCHFFSF